jgi:hypothetical protein
VYLNFAEEVPIDDVSVHAQVAVIPNEVRNQSESKIPRHLRLLGMTPTIERIFYITKEETI